VPIGILEGTTKEKLAEHAKRIKPFLASTEKNTVPAVPGEGSQQAKTPKESAEREAVRQLFGKRE